MPSGIFVIVYFRPRIIPAPGFRPLRHCCGLISSNTASGIPISTTPRRRSAPDRVKADVRVLDEKCHCLNSVEGFARYLTRISVDYARDIDVNTRNFFRGVDNIADDTSHFA